MEYYQKEEPLILPEYGKTIQKMIRALNDIESKEERTKKAYSVIKIMGNMFPYLRDVEEFKHKLWTHLAIMSKYKLDIDYPYEIPQTDSFQEKPKEVPYPQSRIRYKHYGKMTEQMLEYGKNLSDKEKKDKFVGLMANFMKRAYLTWHKDSVEDDKILDDIHNLSGQKIDSSDVTFLATQKILQQAKIKKQQKNGKNNKNGRKGSYK